MPDAPAPTPPQATGPDRKPDAVQFRTGWRPPNPRRDVRPDYQRILHFEEVMGAGPGQTAHIRDVAPDTWLATLSPHDTLLHPEGHPRAKFPRYDWKDGGNGLRFGYLKPDEESPPR